MIDGKRYVVQADTSSPAGSFQQIDGGTLLTPRAIEYDRNVSVEPKVGRIIEEMQRIRSKQIDMEQRFARVQLENET